MRRTLTTLAAAALVTLAGPASALTFADAYSAARAFDAKFQAAGYERDAAQEAIGVARAGLRPSVNVLLSDSVVSGVRVFPNSLSQEVRIRTDYSAPQASLSMRAPVINLEATSALRRAESLALGADAAFQVRNLELIDRLGAAYLDMLLARENQILADNQVIAFEAQLARAEQRMKRGEGTRTDIAQAVAALEVARVRVFEAVDQVALARHGLRRLTGVDATITELKTIDKSFQPPPLVPSDAGGWLDLALRQSPIIQARQQAVEAARFAVQARRAGHYPRLDVVASTSRNQNESISSLNQTSRLTSVGFQLNLPLYSGGGVDAGVRQAAADLSRIEEEARSDREGVEVDVQRIHRLVLSGAAKIEAQRKAVQASEVALEGIGKAVDAGLATGVDVLDAQSKLYLAARDFAQSRYEYLLTRLRLLTQAGLPVGEIIQDIDRMLTASIPINPPTTARAVP
jgi:protease secretion system outer membrane protein